MIHTTMAQLDRYASLHCDFPAAFAALRKLAGAPFAPGVTKLDGERLWVNAIAYETRPEAQVKLEAHRRYIDVMFLAEGIEDIAYAPLSCVTDIQSPYSSGDDAMLGARCVPCGRLAMQPGDVAIFFPEDAHGPGMAAGTMQPVKKLIIKVLLCEEAVPD